MEIASFAVKLHTFSHKFIWTPLSPLKVAPSQRNLRLTPSWSRISTESEPLTTSTALKPGTRDADQVGKLPASTAQPENNGGRPGSARANCSRVSPARAEEGQQMKPKPQPKAETKPNNDGSRGTITGRKAKEEKEEAGGDAAGI